MKHLTPFDKYVNEAFLHEIAVNVYEKLAQYPDKWVHFTRIKKIGINPSETTVHRDPPAIYTYPISWLLENKEKLREEQYGFGHKYFYIVDIDTTIRNLNLSSLTEEECLEIATRNGWGKDYRHTLEHWDHYSPKNRYQRSNTSVPGGKFYYIATRLYNTRKFTWFQMLRGYDSFSDDAGIINMLEPHQRNVFSLRNLKVLDFGLNKKVNPTYEILKLVAAEMGAKLHWHHNRIVITGTYKGRDYEADASHKASSWSFSPEGDKEVNCLWMEEGSNRWDICDFPIDGEANEKTAAMIVCELKKALDIRENRWS